MTLALKLLNIEGPLPTSTYDIYVNATRVGMCQLRHRPGKEEHVPDGFESHIYYEIEPLYRGMGYAKMALRELIIGARHVGLDEVILVVEESNIPSQHVIEANQAEFLGEAKGKDGAVYRKYRIQVRREARKKE